MYIHNTWFLQPRKYYFPGFKYTRYLKITNQDMCKKAYHIYSMYDRLLTFLGYILLLTPSRTFLDFVKFKDISMTSRFAAHSYNHCAFAR